MTCVLSFLLTTTIGAIMGLGSTWINRLDLLVMASMNGFVGF